jgi:hypothetical protein
MSQRQATRPKPPRKRQPELSSVSDPQRASSRPRPWLVRFTGLETSPVLASDIAAFNQAFADQLATTRTELHDVGPGPPEQPNVILQARLDAATVDEAWSRAVRIRDAAAPGAWAALHDQRAPRTGRPAFSWHGPGVQVYALRARGETDTAFVRRRRAKPSTKALRGEGST